MNPEWCAFVEEYPRREGETADEHQMRFRHWLDRLARLRALASEID